MAKFTKKDLKNGDFIVLRNGDIGVVIVDKNSIVFNNGRWDTLTWYNDDLTAGVKGVSGLSIDKVFRHSQCFNAVRDILDGTIHATGDNLVYDRKRDEVEEMTLEEICKALGKNVKIVKGE